MAQYRVRYVSYAAEQLSHLPRAPRAAFHAKIEELKRDPHAAGDYDEHTGSYSTTFGGGTGIILYVGSDEIDMVTIIRVNWVE
ncbi:MAG: type II toxin-antitoxin system RelE family toxin [Pseudonocardiaceae bacterium]